MTYERMLDEQREWMEKMGHEPIPIEAPGPPAPRSHSDATWGRDRHGLQVALAQRVAFGMAVEKFQAPRPRVGLRQRFIAWWCSHASDFARGLA